MEDLSQTDHKLTQLSLRETTEGAGLQQIDNTERTSLHDIPSLFTHEEQLNSLLLLREQTTQQLIDHGRCNPDLILNRACVYEALQYDDLAVFDAYTVYLLCLKHFSDEFVIDLEAHTLDGRPWQPDPATASNTIISSLTMLVRCLHRLDATIDATNMLRQLAKYRSNDEGFEVGDIQLKEAERYVASKQVWRLDLPFNNETNLSDAETGNKNRLFGYSRREIYPWSTREPDRNSSASLVEINTLLASVAPKVEARVTALPDLNDPAKKWYQLGLFAKEDLQPGEEILHEKSLITAIRPLEDAICDACGQDLESVEIDERRECDGVECDVTYCSEDCKQRAAKEYHAPAADEDDEIEDGEEDDETDEATDVTKTDIEPSAASSSQEANLPTLFCYDHTSLSLIGRHTSTTTPEADLYFLLLTRVIAMSITQSTHPLSLSSMKYLWGDFTPSPFRAALTTAQPSDDDDNHNTTKSTAQTLTRTLPFSLQHNIILPLEYLSTLSLSHPDAAPYSAFWLHHLDAWVTQTLYAKFRGVANATESTFDGKPEIAFVHPMWCLANHSCAPNVSWTPQGGERVFMVRHEPVVGDGSRWTGIKAGEEVLGHYTDVRKSVGTRREMLRQVLGGECRCARCLCEEQDG